MLCRNTQSDYRKELAEFHSSATELGGGTLRVFYDFSDNEKLLKNLQVCMCVCVCLYDGMLLMLLLRSVKCEDKCRSILLSMASSCLWIEQRRSRLRSSSKILCSLIQILSFNA